jgi:small nuclear ribonucleoprotein (snRNP)-like protein
MAKMKINRPFDFLEQAKGKFVTLRLADGKEIVGKLRSFDQNLTLVLEDALIDKKRFPIFILRRFSGIISLK